MERSGYVYICSGGETFDSVALAMWGHEKYAAELISMNPEYGNRMMFLGDEILYLPWIDVQEDETGQMATEPEKAPWRD